jgi:hypothetical protein
LSQWNDEYTERVEITNKIYDELILKSSRINPSDIKGCDVIPTAGIITLQLQQPDGTEKEYTITIDVN